MRATCVDYRQLPAQNPLFLDFLYDFEKVESFYSFPSGLDQLKRRAQWVLEQGNRYPRQTLVSLLRSFNKRIGCGEAALENVERLESPRGLTILTGQQVGLFGGPALAVYKAATTILAARALEQEGYSVVPVFWLAADDSDFQEAASTTFLGEHAEPVEIRYPRTHAKIHRMVGTVLLSEVDECLRQLQQRTPTADHKSFVIHLLRQSYRADRTFSEGFAAWMSRLFQDYGLVLFDPLSPGFRRQVQPAVARAVEKRTEILRSLHEHARQLRERGLQPQVAVDGTETLLFWVEGNNRYKLEFLNGCFSAKRRPSRLAEEELLGALRASPERLGHNVLLRPILQDHFFPVVVYVGGPSEIAYYSQVRAICNAWGIETEIFPRAGITLVDRKSQRLLNKYKFRVTDLFDSTGLELAGRVLAKEDAGQVLEGLTGVKDQLIGGLAALKPALGKTDPPLSQMMDGAQKKILYQIEKVERRFVANQREHQSHLGRHLDYLYARLLGRRRLQERSINFNQFLMEEGPGLVGRLMSEMKPFCKAHQILYV
ncbi:MAG: bacillithiol biosynthesis cysteine-adding enzyme BshC [Acidobacteriota bacterium]